MAKPIPTVSSLAIERDPNGSMYPDYRWNSPNTAVASNFAPSAKADKSANIQSGNVSDRSIMDDLYPGATTKVWIYSVDWWGISGHIKNGLDSNSVAQMEAQVQEAARRGAYGFGPTWFGRGNNTKRAEHNAVHLKLRDACVKYGLKLMLQYEPSAYNTSADPDAEFQADINYANLNYFNSPCYEKKGGRPIFQWFNHDPTLIDYAGAAKTYNTSHGNALWIFRHATGADYSYSDGGYGWTSGGMSYVDDLYTKFKTRDDDKIMFGLLGKGFNDTLASWGKNRITAQRNAQEWIDRVNAINSRYNSINQLEHAGVETWNDYEEGHETETGIYAGFDTITATLGTDGTLAWNIPSGNANALAHVIVWSTQDNGVTLTRRHLVVGAAAKSNGVNVKTLGLASGTYKFYVQAVGKAFIQNGMAPSVTFTIDGGGTPPPTTDPIKARLAVFSDVHINRADPGAALTKSQLDTAVTKAKPYKPDRGIVSGDLSGLGSGYTTQWNDVKTRVGVNLGVPVKYIPGNWDCSYHFNQAAWVTAFGPDSFTEILNGIGLVYVNTTKLTNNDTDQDPGILLPSTAYAQAQAVIDWINSTARAAMAGKDVVFCIQHHPMEVNATQNPGNNNYWYVSDPAFRDQLRTALKSLGNFGVKYITSGHTHISSAIYTLNGITQHITPSTCYVRGPVSSFLGFSIIDIYQSGLVKFYDIPLVGSPAVEPPTYPEAVIEPPPPDPTTPAPPTVIITAPANNANPPGPNVLVTATAVAPGEINVMQLYVDGSKMTEQATLNFNYNAALPEGARRLTIRALDKLGQVTTATVNIIVGVEAPPPDEPPPAPPPDDTNPIPPVTDGPVITPEPGRVLCQRFTDRLTDPSNPNSGAGEVEG